MNRLLRRITDWYAHSPPDMPRGVARINPGAKIGYSAGVLAHAGLVPLFLFLDQTVLGFYNILSTAIFAAGFWLHLTGRPATGLVMIFLEVLVASALATVYLGTGTLFFVYAAIVIVYVPLAVFIVTWLRWALIVASFFSFLGQAVYGIHVAPLQQLALGWETAFALFNGGLNAILILAVVFTYHRAVDLAEAALEAEFEKSEALLHNIMPPAVAERLKDNPEVIADSHKPVTILFADIVGFTELSGRSTPEDLVSLLNKVFSRFDALVDAAELEKIKTIGDAYMVVAGLPAGRDDHADAVARLALDMMAATDEVARETGEALRIRVGIHSGEVVAGVIGQRKFAYDIWGDTVNVAARMESTGIAGRIQISADTAGLLRDRFAVEHRGDVEVKGKGTMETWFLTAEKAAAAVA